MRKADDFRKAKRQYLEEKRSGIEPSKQIFSEDVLQAGKAASQTSSALRRRTISPRMTVDSFANELIFKIFSYLDAKSLLSCASTCKRWETIAGDNSFWKFLYIKHVYIPPKGATESCVIGPPAPLEAANKHWKVKFINEAKAVRNKRYARLQKISPYTGVTDRVKDVLERLGAKFQMCLTTKKGLKFMLVERKRFGFITSTLVQWYSLKPTPKFSEIAHIEVFSLTPIITQKDGFMLRTGPRSKNLIFAEKINTAEICKEPCFKNEQLETFITEAGLLISLWKGTDDIAFLWVTLHHYNLLKKCLKSTSGEIYRSPHIPKPDDVSRMYGLQGYKIHVQVCSGHASIWDTLYHTDTMSCNKCPDAVRFAKNNEAEGCITVALDSKSLPWKTDVFDGKIEDMLLLSITVTDINTDVMWQVARPVKCNCVKLKAVNFDSLSDDGVQISHCDKIGRFDVTFVNITDGGYALDSLCMFLNLSFINSWFGTKY